MTDQKETCEVTVEDLAAEVVDLKGRLNGTRDEAWKLIDSNDRLRRELKRRRDLLGPGYRYPMVCSDGRTWGAPAESAREETIRWYAGNIVGGILARGTDDETVAVEAATLIAFDLWDEIEGAFQKEREKRAAAAEVVAKVSQDETSQNETRNGDAE